MIKLADGGAVRTLHIIGVNLELRLGVHARGGRSTEVAVPLIGLHPRATELHKYASGKGTHSIVVEHIFEHFVAVAARCIMGNESVSVDVLGSAGDGHSQQLGAGVLAIHLHMIVVTGEPIGQGDAVHKHIAASVLLNVEG